MNTDKGDIHVITRNRKARHDYTIMDTFEAGIELVGSEVKSIRAGKLNLADSYAFVENGQLWLKNLHITPYPQAATEQPDPDRTRRLLMHKREIAKLTAKTQQQGLTLVPLSVYVKGKHVKIELALAAGRKKYDKREAIAKAEADRRMKQATRRNMDR